MNGKIVKMCKKFNTLYTFMVEMLGLEEKEALQNTLKLEGAVSEEVLYRLKNYINFTLHKFSTDPNYMKEFQEYYEKSKQNY